MQCIYGRIKMDKVICEVCGAARKQITVGHVRQHGFANTAEYVQKYPAALLFSESTKEARRKSRRLVVANPAKDSQSNKQFHIPKSRTKERISYETFLELMSEGNSLRDMKNSGISKHQVGFYSALSQNKIAITRDQFETEYKSGKSLNEIAKQYNIQRDHITQLREYFGIKRLGPKYINRKKTEKTLTHRQKMIVYGGLLGDASKMSAASIKMKQSTKQKEYLMWKYEELKEHVSPKSLQESSSYDDRYKKEYHAIRFYTFANTEIEEIIQKFYGENGKWVSDDVLDHLDELGLAVWFMDDGVTDWHHRGHGKTSGQRPDCKLCTDSFSSGDCERIVLWFEEVWGLYTIPTAVWGRPQHTRIRFNTDNTEKFFALIKPFIVPSMFYKVDYDAYVEHRKLKGLNT